MTELAVELQDVAKAYPHFALENMQLALPRGRIMGFVGPNGAGKSTTLRIIMGLVHADRGQVRVLGHDMPDQQVAAKRDVGYASEDMRLYKRATLAWHMDFIRSIYPGWDQKYADDLLRRFDLVAAQKIKGMSHGQQVKAALLLILVRRPRLLVLDEPTTGLDPVARQEVLAEMMEVLRDEDRTVIFSSHNTQDIEKLSDVITFVDRGRLIDSRDKEDFLDRWRRLRLDVPPDVVLPALPGLLGVEGSGRLKTAITGNYSPEQAAAVQQAGATILQVENLTLEEIFVAEVQHSRNGGAR